MKSRTVLYLLIPTGLMALRSPMLLVVALPTFAWRFVSDRFTYWEPWFHYDAVLVPIAVAAMIEGAACCTAGSGPWASRRRRRHPRAGTDVPVLAGLADGLLGHAAPHRGGRQALDRIPTGAGSPPPTPSARGSRCARTST